MRILDKYILKKYLFNLILGTVGSVVIFFAFDFFTIIQRVTEGKLSILSAPSAALQAIPAIVSYEMMHLAALIASLLTMNDLRSHLEVVALKTSGISFIRIIRAPLLASFSVSIAILIFTEFVSVITFRNKREILGKNNAVVLFRNKSEIYYRSGNRFFRLGNVDGYSNIVKNIQIVDVVNNEVDTIINGAYALYNPENRVWTMKDVVINKIRQNEIIEEATYIADIKESIDDFLNYRIMSIRDQLEKYSYSKELSFKEINDNIKFLEKAGGNYRRLLTHVYHQRVAYPFSVFVMTLIGFALLSKFSRAGVGNAITYGILVGFAYYVILEIAKAMGIGSVTPILVSAWLPNIVFLLIGLYFLSEADE